MKILNKEVSGTRISLGEFQVVGNTILVTDPCYSLGTWCQVQIKKAEPGNWKGYLFNITNQRDIDRINEEIAYEEKNLEYYSKIEVPFETTERGSLIESLTKSTKERISELMGISPGIVNVLLAHHDSIDPFTSFENEWKLVKGTAGVDSGQMAICGLEFWKQNPLDYEGEESITESGMKNRGTDGDYWKIWELTSKNHGGVYKNGAIVSATGYGDGSYDVFQLRANKKVVGVAVVFTPDYDL